MDISNTEQQNRLWKEARQRVGVTQQARARWLWDQLTLPPPTRTSKISYEARNHWTAFLSGEGIPLDMALSLVSSAQAITNLKAQLHRALDQLRQTGSTDKVQCNVERFWSLSESRLTPVRLLLNPSDSQERSAFIATIALDCLTSGLRQCGKPKCHELFMAWGKKKYCSKKCALGVAKVAYRARKRCSNAP